MYPFRLFVFAAVVRILGFICEGEVSIVLYAL